RPFRLKTKAARGIGKLQAAHAEISQNPVVGRWSFVVRKIGKRSMSKFHRWPVSRLLLPLPLANDQRRTTNDASSSLQTLRLVIEATQMTRCSESLCDF